MSNRNDFVNSLKNMSEQDLKSRVEEVQLRLKKRKFAHAVSPLENPMSIRDVRKDLARTKTELRKKQSNS
jgi:large subunit ribosomal protein L29